MSKLSPCQVKLGCVIIILMLDPRNIIRTNKRTLSLMVNANGELIVKAPYNYPDHKIFAFIKEKEDWIIKKQNAIRSNSYINPNVVNYTVFLFLGKELTPLIANDVKEILISDNKLLIPTRIPNDKILGKIEKWYRKVAAEVLVERVQYWAQKLRLRPNEITTNNNKTRWGVCDNHANIAINWRAIFLPPNLLDYIVVHELCHLLEFNHTQAFWNVVGNVIPDYQILRKHLKCLNYLILLFRKE